MENLRNILKEQKCQKFTDLGWLDSVNLDLISVVDIKLVDQPSQEYQEE